MKYRNLGRTGLKVSVAGMGCNNFGVRCDEVQSKDVIHAALDAGINLFDTADVYGNHHSELFLGRAIAGMDRTQVLIGTKFGNPMGGGILQKGGSRHYIHAAVDASLKRLNTDYIDLYQHHIPDRHTPIEETLSALDDLVRAGKVRYIGSSNYNAWQIADADWTSTHQGYQHFVTAQNHYNLLERRIETEVLPACSRFNIGMLPYFPLASGLLTGKYTRGREAPPGTRLANFGERGKRALSDENFDVVDKLTECAAAHEKSILQLAMSWLASNPLIPSVIAGATTPAQVQANAEAVAWQLSAQQMDEINGILTDRS